MKTPQIYHCRQSEAIDLELDLYGRPLPLHINFVNQPLRLSDIVPMARAITEKITHAIIKATQQQTDTIPCKKGCCACCNYIVPLSVPEAFRLREEILAKPRFERKRMVRFSLLAARKILRHKPPALFLKQDTQPESGYQAQLEAISHWYQNLQLSCPFLDNQTCGIYEQRPLACREYFVTGLACSSQASRHSTEVIDMPLRITNILGELAAEFEGRQTDAIILPLTLAWCEENLPRNERKYPGAELIQRFIELIKTSSKIQNRLAVAVPATYQPYNLPDSST